MKLFWRMKKPGKSGLFDEASGTPVELFLNEIPHIIAKIGLALQALEAPTDSVAIPITKHGNSCDRHDIVKKTAAPL